MQQRGLVDVVAAHAPTADHYNYDQRVKRGQPGNPTLAPLVKTKPEKLVHDRCHALSFYSIK
jgi:hypothetical protein